VKQTLFEFVIEHELPARPVLQPKIEQELIEQIAEAILAVADAKGGRRDEPRRRPS
jgi:hypothetical protein